MFGVKYLEFLWVVHTILSAFYYNIPLNCLAGDRTIETITQIAPFD